MSHFGRPEDNNSQFDDDLAGRLAGSPDDDALRLLAGWAATHDPADAPATGESVVSRTPGEQDGSAS